MKLLSNTDKQKCKYQLHPKALEAANFYQKLSKKCALEKLPSHNIDQFFQQNRTYYATRIASINEIYIFSGFEFLQFTPHLIATTSANIILYSDMTPKEIEEIAWAGVFRSIFSSVDSPKALSEIQLLSSELIADNKPIPFKFSDSELSRIFNFHRSTTSKQKTTLKEKWSNIETKNDEQKKSTSSFPPIFDELK
ncbi:hypothetical protein [Psychromonas antarctica]|uniref:hypothetical protein n=1 Tax=Psychromonas antarctica TaxID=67573 RepID=UPI001EE90579|nr:hypothetical protein [Psychromonas antarctica]MCG6202144.1 hypothetical protein [Psychromonas antarctica]